METRAMSGTARPPGARSVNPDKQISQIEKSVTHLLVATKQLLETLTQWSRGNAQEEEVSDVYVRLGYEFNLACRAFNSIGVETADLGPVPDLLRSILEDTLSQPASPQSLDNYLPRIRDIIINLLHGLKRKQSKLRSRSSKDGSSKTPAPPVRQASVSSVATSEAGFASMADSASLPSGSVRSDSRQESVRSADEPAWPAAASSTSNMLKRNSGSLHRHSVKSQSRSVISPEAQTPSIAPPVITPPAETERLSPSIELVFSHPPPPPPKQDALTALQRGGDLERRASRRFSAYQIQKHLGASSNGVPVIPPSQNSPIPNRGREVKESMSAVRSRTSYASTRQRPPPRLAEIANTTSSAGRVPPARISEERDDDYDSSSSPPKNDLSPQPTEGIDSPTVQTPEEFEGPRPILSPDSVPVLGPTVLGPLSPPPQEYLTRSNESFNASVTSPHAKEEILADHATELNSYLASTTPQQSQQLPQAELSPPQSKELTLFLQYKSKIKKFVLAEGYEELTIARLQLAFIEKFNWHTHNNGVDLPEIYIQDPVSGVRHELEDLNDVKDRSVLVLNVEMLDEVKKHFDEGIGGLKSTLEGVRSLLDGQGSLMQRFSDRQLETSKEMARLSAAPAPRPTRGLIATSPTSSNGISASESSMAEVQNLRRDIAVLRQTYSTMSSDFTAAMKDIKLKAENVKATATQAAAPSYEGDAGRAHVNQGKKTLNSESEALVNRVDDLSDAVEDLRKDVVTRGVRPLPRQLEDINREITATAKDLMKIKEFLKREKPIWTKIWEHELNLVCTERDDLTQQEDLMADLDGDLDDVTGVFKLVEEAMKQQNLQGPGQVGFRNTSRALDIDPSIDPQSAKDGMLDEVRALQPNHESRLEAIERAEKARLKELETRKEGEFQREVATFVEEGKLKKTGGMEEVERLRKIKDERARKENFERQAQMNLERERKRAEAAAKKAAAASAAAAVATSVTATQPDTNGNGQGGLVPNSVTTEENNVEVQATDPAIETPLTEANTSDPANDTSQGELSFQDAPESVSNTSPKPLAPIDNFNTPETPTQMQITSPTTTERSETNGSSGRDSKASNSEHVADATTQEKDVESEASDTSKADRSSWWKPAIFNP